jgi:hypothetical protein
LYQASLSAAGTTMPDLPLCSRMSLLVSRPATMPDTEQLPALRSSMVARSQACDEDAAVGIHASRLSAPAKNQRQQGGALVDLGV